MIVLDVHCLAFSVPLHDIELKISPTKCINQVPAFCSIKVNSKVNKQ